MTVLLCKTVVLLPAIFKQISFTKNTSGLPTPDPTPFSDPVDFKLGRKRSRTADFVGN